MQQVGILIGNFESFHLGHARQIMHAVGHVESLHIFITPSINSNPNFTISLKDKARWLSMAFADLPFIKLHLLETCPAILDFEGLDFDVNAAATHQAAQSDAFIADADAFLAGLLSQYHILDNSNQSVVLCLSESHPLANASLALPILPLPQQPQYPTQQVQQNPAQYWSALHPQTRASYTKTVAIVGGESSGKTTLLHKLVNYYGASYALEMGRLFVETDLGGTELGMQYDDYPLMATDHAAAVRRALQQAPAPVTLVDTDFVTTQAFCEEYEGQTHPFLTACIDEFRFDYTIMLENNTPWVADGMRSLGSSDQRQRFENRLKQIFARHHIEPILINAPDYHQRFLQTVAWIDQHIFHAD